MGNCCGNRLAYLEDLDYKQTIELKIIERDRAGNCMGKALVFFGLTSPVDQIQSLMSLLKTTMRISGCVLPGLDPREEIDKDCQDSFGFLNKDNSLLCILFDGHGKTGRKVSLYCRDFMLAYFERNSEDFEMDPKSSIFEMMEQCDATLSASGIECTLSGATAVVVLINSLGIHAGSVGDSRAVLGSLPKDNTQTVPVPTKRIPFRRPVLPTRTLNAIALTVDQKPNHDEELQRILGAGGVVEKLADEIGRPIGPYRVWKKKGNLPGLAMSRSLGDRAAHEIGVISTPIYHSFQLFLGFDSFIVLASDGVWDVMENWEVVNFVEKFRNNSKNGGSEYPARLSNSSIARLLCEEARYRWLGVVEEEDVMIDDISCVIVEFISVGESQGGAPGQRGVADYKSFSIDNPKVIEGANAVRKDPKRGSMANDDKAIEEALTGL